MTECTRKSGHLRSMYSLVCGPHCPTQIVEAQDSPGPQRATKRCRLFGLTNRIAPAYISDRLERKRQNVGGAHGAQLNFGDLTPYLYLTSEDLSLPPPTYTILYCRKILPNNLAGTFEGKYILDCILRSIFSLVWSITHLAICPPPHGSFKPHVNYA
jgi:hypothetical protein